MTHHKKRHKARRRRLRMGAIEVRLVFRNGETETCRGTELDIHVGLVGLVKLARVDGQVDEFFLTDFARLTSRPAPSEAPTPPSCEKGPTDIDCYEAG